MANIFDQAARYAVKADPLGFFRWLAPGLDPAVQFASWLDTRTVPLPGEPDRTCDTVAEFATSATPGQRWAVVVELQTEPAPDLLDRLLEYLARLRRELRHGPGRRERYQVVAMLLNLTGPPQPDALEMALPGQALPWLRWQVLVRTLRDEDAAGTLAAIAAGQLSRGLLPWISLMRGSAESRIIEQWKQVARLEPDASLRGGHVFLVIVFAELTQSQAQWREGLKGWDMRESTLVNELKAEWIAEGQIKDKRASLLRVLELRFQVVPGEIVSAVASQSDLNVLSDWFDRALMAPTLDDFRHAIGA